MSMTRLRLLAPADLDAALRLAQGYVSPERYVVTRQESDAEIVFRLQRQTLANPYERRWTIDAPTRAIYHRVLGQGLSAGLQVGSELVAAALAEAQAWNRTLWVWEFHVASAYRRQGLGRRLMEYLAGQGRAAGLRIIECETQNTNVPAIRFYRALGFALEGLDLSRYSNADMASDGEVALLMKRRLE